MSDTLEKMGADRNWGAKAGETIAGRLSRGQDGKFSGGGSGPAAAKKKPARGRGASAARSRAAAAAAKRAQLAAERKAKAEQKAAERAAAKAAKEAEKKAKADAKAKEKAAKAKAGGGGGGGGKDKEKEKLAEQQAKLAAQQSKDAQRQLDQLQRQSAADARRQQMLTDRNQRRTQMDTERHARQAATTARQQASDARRSALDQARAQRQAASDARRDRLDAARAARQSASDTRRAKLDAMSQERQARMDARRDKLDAERKARQDRQDAQRSRTATKEPTAAKPTSTRSTAAPTAAKPTSTTTAAPAPAATTADGATPLMTGRYLRANSIAPLGTLKLDKALHAPDYHGFFAITKRDDAERVVEGVASTEHLDMQGGIYKGQPYDGDIVDPEAIAKALPDYMAWANLREMHQPSAVGTVLKAWFVDGALHIIAKIVDDDAWKKVVDGVYKGFSIGGYCLDAAIEKIGTAVARRITALRMTEISLVDRPANPDAKITLWKGQDMDLTDETPDVPGEAVAKAAGGGDPQKAIVLLQQLRDAAELQGDLEGAEHYSLAIAAALEAAGIAAPSDDLTDDVSDDTDTDAGDDVAMADGLDLGDDAGGAGDDDSDVVAMAAQIGDIAKAGRQISGANMAHLTNIHDAIMKMSGGAVCKGAGGVEPPAPPATNGKPAVAMAASAGDLAKAIGVATQPLIEQIAKLQGEIEALKAQPAPGGPIQRGVPVEKRLASQADPPASKPAPTARSRDDLQRLALTEPNLQLRADYARQLAALEQAS